MTNYLLFLAITFSVCLKVINCEHCGFIDPEEVNLVLYKEAIESVSLNNVDKILNHEFFYPEREIVIFAFDFLENISSPSVQEISESFLEQGSYNFLVLDYGKFSGGNYFFDALPNAVKVRIILNVIDNYLKLNLKTLKNFEIFGNLISFVNFWIFFFSRLVNFLETSSLIFPTPTSLMSAKSPLLAIHSVLMSWEKLEELSKNCQATV